MFRKFGSGIGKKCGFGFEIISNIRKQKIQPAYRSKIFKTTYILKSGKTNLYSRKSA
jgi:hypothetical protein